MKERNYNPLNEGYTGGKYEKRGYTGTTNQSGAPESLPSIESAVAKPSDTQKPIDKSNQTNTDN